MTSLQYHTEHDLFFFYIILHDCKNAGTHKNSMIMLISNMYIQKMIKLLKLLK